MSEGNGWLSGFKADYQAIFVEEWSPFVGAMLLVLTIIGGIKANEGRPWRYPFCIRFLK